MTSAAGGRWADLRLRLLSAIVMIAVGGVELWLGGRYFHGFVGIVVALMLWELVRMLAPGRRGASILIGGTCGGVVALLPELQEQMSLTVMLAILVLLGALSGLSVGERRRFGIPYAMLILIGGFSLILVRDNLGFGWVIWLVLVVVASDVAGYFAGKAFGGPKFWPAISPKKTWSGTVAGWIGAACIGAIFGLNTGIYGLIVVLSLVLAFAAQLGDIAESAIKRRSGVKDSSRLIPGHGGVLDRFDGLLGASFAFLLFAMVSGMPRGFL